MVLGRKQKYTDLKLLNFNFFVIPLVVHLIALFVWSLLIFHWYLFDILIDKIVMWLHNKPSEFRKPISLIPSNKNSLKKNQLEIHKKWLTLDTKKKKKNYTKIIDQIS